MFHHKNMKHLAVFNNKTETPQLDALSWSNVIQFIQKEVHWWCIPKDRLIRLSSFLS